MAEVDNGVLLDLDGTLVDSVFHHVLAWDQAFSQHGYTLPLWRIHAGIGMGGHRLIPWLLGRQVPEADDLSRAHLAAFETLAPRLRPTRGALELLEDLDTRGVPYRVATSSGAETRAILLKVLGREDLATTDADEVAASKPAADLLVSGADQLQIHPHRTTLVGDSPWDAEAARRVGVRCIAVRCGGFGDDRLRAAGAVAVEDDPLCLVGRL